MLRGASFSTVALTACVTASTAQDLSGWYVGVEASSAIASHGTHEYFTSFIGQQMPTSLEARAYGFIAGWNGYVAENVIAGFEARVRSDFGSTELFRRPDRGTFDVGAYRETFAPSVNFRLGYQSGRTMIYGLVGAGRSVGTLDFRGEYGDFVVSFVKHDFDELTLSAGLGLEYHFDRYFGRLEGEVRHADWDVDQIPDTQYRATAAIGIRF